jgi:hypothetical protein
MTEELPKQQSEEEQPAERVPRVFSPGQPPAALAFSLIQARIRLERRANDPLGKPTAKEE